MYKRTTMTAGTMFLRQKACCRLQGLLKRQGSVYRVQKAGSLSIPYKRLWIVKALVLVFVCLSPGLFPADGGGIAVTMASPVHLSRKKAAVTKGSGIILELKGTADKVTWETSDRKVAVVTKKGKKKALVTGKKTGKAVISAKAGKKKYECLLRVQSRGLDKRTISVKKGKTATIRMLGGGRVKWTSSDKKTAKIVSMSGRRVKIRALKAGTAVIRARSGKKTFRCRVSVTGKRRKSTGENPAFREPGGKERKRIKVFAKKHGLTDCISPGDDGSFPYREIKPGTKLPYSVKWEFIYDDRPMPGPGMKQWESVGADRLGPGGQKGFNKIRYTIKNESGKRIIFYTGEIGCIDKYMVKESKGTITYFGKDSFRHEDIDCGISKIAISPGSSRTFTDVRLLRTGDKGYDKDGLLLRTYDADTRYYGVFRYADPHISFHIMPVSSGPRMVHEKSGKTPALDLYYDLTTGKGVYCYDTGK